MNYHLVKLSALASASTYGGKIKKKPSPIILLNDCGFKKTEKIFTGTFSSSGSSSKNDNDHCTVYSGKSLYKTYTGDAYKGLDEKDKKKLMNLFCDAGISKESYDKFRTVGGITSSAYSAKDYCQNGIAKAMIKDKQIKEEGYRNT